MRAVKLAGWAILVMVLVLVGTDVFAVIARGANHPVVTMTHGFFFVIGLMAVGMTNDDVTNRIARMASAFRGRKED